MMRENVLRGGGAATNVKGFRIQLIPQHSLAARFDKGTVRSSFGSWLVDAGPSKASAKTFRKLSDTTRRPMLGNGVDESSLHRTLYSPYDVSSNALIPRMLASGARCIEGLMTHSLKFTMIGFISLQQPSAVPEVTS